MPNVGHDADVLMVLGGPPRCGKTMLAERFARSAGSVGFPLTPSGTLWPYSCPSCTRRSVPASRTIQRPTCSFRISARWWRAAAISSTTTSWRASASCPATSAALASGFGMRPVFVGMQHVQLDTLLATEGRNQWHRDLDAATLAIVPAWIESWSRQLEAECAPLGIPYVESATTSKQDSRRKRLLSGAPNNASATEVTLSVGSWGGGGRRVGPWVVCRCRRRAPSRGGS